MDINTRSSWGEKNRERQVEGVEAGVTTGHTKMNGNGGPAQVPEGPAGKMVIIIIVPIIREVAHSSGGLSRGASTCSGSG